MTLYALDLYSCDLVSVLVNDLRLSASSPFMVQVFGTGFRFTPQTFVVLRLYAKLSRLVRFHRNCRHCNALSVFMDVVTGHCDADIGRVVEL